MVVVETYMVSTHVEPQLDKHKISCARRVSRARKEKRDMQLGVAGERSVVMTHGGVGSGQIVGIPEQRCRE